MTTDVLDRWYPSEVVHDVYEDGSPCYLARHPDLPGCSVNGDSLEEAESLLVSAKRVYLKHLIANNLPIPEPTLQAPRPRPRGLWTYQVYQTSVRRQTMTQARPAYLTPTT